MNPSVPILLAEDDENDVLLVQRALRKAGVPNPIQVVGDGQQAIDYLMATGIFSDRTVYPFPSCIITDLKMPKKNGFDILAWLNEHPECKVIPTIVLTSSSQVDDIRRAYSLGANCYFVKPNGSDDLQRLISTVFQFWHLAAVPSVSGC